MGGWRGWFSETFLEVQLPHTSGAATCGPVARHAILAAFVFIVECLCSTVCSEGVELVRLSALRSRSRDADPNTQDSISTASERTRQGHSMCAHSLRTSPLCSRTIGALEPPHNAAQGLTNLRRIRQPKRRGFGDFGVALRGVNRIVSHDSSMSTQLHTHHSVYVRAQFAADTILHEFEPPQNESADGFRIRQRIHATCTAVGLHV